MVRRTIVATLLLALAGGVTLERDARAQNAAAQQDLDECKRLLEDGKLAKAARKCDDAIRRDPRGVGAGGYYQRATIFLRQKKYAEGVQWVDSVALKAYPGDAGLLEVKAALLTKVPGKFDEAIKIAEEAVAKDSKRFAAQRLLGDYYARPSVRKYKQAVAAYEAYLGARPEEQAKGDGLVLVQLGFSYVALGAEADEVSMHRKAEDAFNRALKIAGGDSTVGPNAQKGKCVVLVARAQLENEPKLFDQAITICEAVIKARKALKQDASPYYNVGIAYLERNQLEKAMNAANSYIQQKPNEFRGYLLRGKIYFRQKKFNEAEGQFSRANELAAAAGDANNTEIALARGKNFLAQKQAPKAIALLEKVASQRPNDVEVLTELARAQLEAKQPKNAATTAQKALKLEGQEKNVPLLVLAGDAHYAADELKEARSVYMRAFQINKNDVRAKNGAINTIVRMAHVPFAKGNLKDAQEELQGALAIDNDSLVVNFNLGVIALEQGDAKSAIKFLTVRAKKQPNEPVNNRLLAKAYLAMGDTKKADEYYAKAEAGAKQERLNLLLAEIYVEWAPLLIAQGKVEDAVEKLEIADQYAANQPFQKAAQRNLQVAYFKRGYDRWRARKTSEAISDLEGAVRYPANLQKGEEDAFTFALGLAYLSSGQEAKALPIFQKYSKANNLPFLKAPWDKIGADFFMAYAWYREGTAASRKQAAAAFGQLVGKTSGAIGVRTKQLLRSSWEWVAWDAFNGGDLKNAENALKKAEGYASAGEKAQIDHNQGVLTMLRKGNAEQTFSRLGDNPPEALVNLGIIKDQQGDAKRAYELWTQAKAKGVRSAKLDEWIEAKKRIFNF